jgi:hypothetical protein
MGSPKARYIDRMKHIMLISLLCVAVAVAASAQSKPQTSARLVQAAPSAELRPPIVLANPFGCIDHVCSTSSNLTWDALGTPDARPGAWGNNATVIVPYTFMNVPGGYRVEVERMYGDVIAWIHATPPVLPLAGSHAGVLFSVQSTAPDSGGLTNAESNCFIYHQGAVPAEGSLTSPFDNRTDGGGVLNLDNTMNVKLAVFLNDSGAPVHQELTFIVGYRFILVE